MSSAPYGRRGYDGKVRTRTTTLLSGCSSVPLEASVQRLYSLHPHSKTFNEAWNSAKKLSLFISCSSLGHRPQIQGSQHPTTNELRSSGFIPSLASSARPKDIETMNPIECHFQIWICAAAQHRSIFDIIGAKKAFANYTNLRQLRRDGEATMGFHLLLYIVFLCILNAVNGGDVPSTASYKVISSSALSVDYNVAEITATYPQDVYLPQGAACTACNVSNWWQNTSCICDYSSNSTACGTTSPGCPPCSSLGDDSFDICNTKDFIQIQLNKTYTVTLSAETSYYYARFFNTVPCRGYWMDIQTIEGRINMASYPVGDRVTWVNSQPLPFTRPWYGGSYGYQCPNDLGLDGSNMVPFGVGTTEFVFFSSQSYQTGIVRFNFTLRVFEEAPAQGPTTDVFQCTATPPTSSPCITDRIEYRFIYKQHQVYNYYIPGCRLVTMRVNDINSDSYLSFTTDATDYNVTNPEYITSTYDDGPRLITRSFCPPPGKDGRWILIKMNKTVLYSSVYSHLTIDSVALPYAATSPHFQLKPINQLSAYSGTDLSETSLVHIKNVTLRCQTGSFSTEKHGCANLYQASVTMTTPILPYPDWMYQPIFAISGASAVKANPTQNVSQILSYFYRPNVAPRTITNYVILNYTAAYATTTFFNEADLQQATLLLRHVTDSNGYDLGAHLNINASVPVCDPNGFKFASAVYDDSMSLINSTTQFSAVPTLRNRIETILTHPNWTNCLIQMYEFAVPSGNTTYQINACNSTQGTVEYQQDPCCSDQAAWGNICDFTNSFTYPTAAASDSRVAQSCRQSNCVKSLVSDFLQTKQGIRCSSSVQSDSNYRILDVYNSRVCAKKIYGTDTNWEGSGRGNVTCLSDSDCPNGAFCDHATRICSIYNATQLDIDFTACVFDTLAPEERNYIANLVGFTFNTPSRDLAAAYVNSTAVANSKCESTIDLAGFTRNINYRYVPYVFIISSRVGGFMSLRGNMPSLFAFRETTALDYTNSAQAVLSSTPVPACSTNYTCNNLDITCDGSTGADCLQVCNDGVEACMVCVDDHNCRSVPGNLTMEQCLDTTQCVKVSPRVPGPPSLSYYNSSSPTQCQDPSNSYCSEFCGFECTNTAFDIPPTADGGFCYTARYDNCTALKGTISTNTKACYLNLQRPDCETAGYLFVQQNVCGALSTTNQCFACHTGHASCSNISYFYAGCNVTRKACPDQNSCLNSGGYCVGQEQMLAWSPTFKGREFGVCVVPKISAVELGVIASCDFSRGQFTSGDSCFDYNYDMAGCRAVGGNWTLPATDAATCQARMACQELLPNSQYRSTLANLFIRGFSPKSLADCVSIYNEQVTSPKWTNVYTWRAAKWVTPSARRAQWRQQKAIIRQRVTKGFTVDQLLITLASAGSFKKQITTFSELQCRFDPTIQILDYVCCGCFGGTGGCSGLQEIASSSNRICNKSPYTVMPIPQGVAITTNYTSVIDPTCSAVQLFAYSEGNFRVTQQVSLADSLVKIAQYNPFDITNEKGATIGTLLSNGITVLTDVRFTHYNVCFPLDSSVRSAPKGYIEDLATVVDGSLVPLNMPYFQDAINGICFTVVTPQKNASWFYVSHVPLWQDVDRVLYPYSTRVLLYTLATLFLVAALLCIMAGVSFFFIDRQTKLKAQSYATVAFTLLFTATRCAYFYILPGGITSNAVDYVLIVLPTFFYFSSVVQLVSTWIALATMSISKLNRQKYTNRSTNIGALIFHVLLYIVFLIIVLLFQFNPPTITPNCGRSVVYPVDSSVQRNLSLAYAVIIAITSVAIGVFFLVFGLQTIRKFTGAAGGKVKKVTVTTFVYTVAFILHCGYIFILIFANPPIIVIFIGFILTEVIPAIFLAVNQIQHREVLAAVRSKTSRRSKMSAMGSSKRNRSEKHLMGTPSISLGTSGESSSAPTNELELATAEPAAETTEATPEGVSCEVKGCGSVKGQRSESDCLPFVDMDSRCVTVKHPPSETKIIMSKPNILVLGGLGFIGRNLVAYLVKNDLAGHIRVADKGLPALVSMNEEHTAIFEKIDFKQANLAREASVNKVFDDGDYKWNLVFNCAGETKYSQTEEVYKENIIDVSKTTAKAAASRNIGRFIELSTAQVYDAGKKASAEEDKVKPWTKLAKAKLQAEEEIKNIAGLSYIIVRPANVYGPGDITSITPRLIIAAVYKNLGEKMEFLWDKELKINTVHITDVVAALWHLSQKGQVGQTYNLADTNETDQGSVNKLLEVIFGIKTDFMGNIKSKLATAVAMKTVADTANSNHLGPWSTLCKEQGITNTPLTPYLDEELLYSNSLSVDGTKITATGFTYQHPKMSEQDLREVLAYFQNLGYFPKKF
ncbi:NAD-dependent epimerase/dehydratase family protein [Planoprotostelium fungivorum]|uniref:NAD-dependent epimerase/dehydratase family protein n=1 Tax=Planoprotostelium fungivorum TaxID=1890364 RepID=A0A2P6NXI1_9EUKA|nr:NAD-dependent epimerase/dehydratase family protein [Planoprotostelium fungivorum]